MKFLGRPDLIRPLFPHFLNCTKVPLYPRSISTNPQVDGISFPPDHSLGICFTSLCWIFLSSHSLHTKYYSHVYSEFSAGISISPVLSSLISPVHCKILVLESSVWWTHEIASLLTESCCQISHNYDNFISFNWSSIPLRVPSGRRILTVCVRICRPALKPHFNILQLKWKMVAILSLDHFWPCNRHLYWQKYLQSEYSFIGSVFLISWILFLFFTSFDPRVTIVFSILFSIVFVYFFVCLIFDEVTRPLWIFEIWCESSSVLGK